MGFRNKNKATALAWRTKSGHKYATLPGMDERRKRVLLFAAAILAARKPSEFDGNSRYVSATMSAIKNAIIRAEQILKVIDQRRPAK